MQHLLTWTAWKGIQLLQFRPGDPMGYSVSQGCGKLEEANGEMGVGRGKLPADSQ